jgi:hypothetical protein
MYRIKVCCLTRRVFNVAGGGGGGGGDDEDDEAEETEEIAAASQFVETVLKYLLQGIDVKEKFVRLRVCQLIALAMNSLGEIEYLD